MKIEYNIVKEDYKKALIEFLINEFYKRIIFVSLLAFVISTVYIGNNFEWVKFIIAFFAAALIVIVLLFGRSFYNIYKTDKIVGGDPEFVGKKTIEIDSEGIITGTENQSKYLWTSILKIDNLSSYIIIILQNNTSIIINKKELTNEEINNFLGKIKIEIPNQKTNSNLRRSKNIVFIPTAVRDVPPRTQR